MQRRTLLKQSILACSSLYFTKAIGTENSIKPDWSTFKNTYLSAAKNPSGQFSIQQIDKQGNRQFSYSLPSRGHAFAVLSEKYVVAIGRRPANYFLVIDLRNARSSLVSSDSLRRFYGHGVFSPNGKYLYLTENDLQTGSGRVGVYEVSNAFKKIKEFSSFGVGPHDIAFDRHGDQLVIANGGIRTHPATGRKKLNIDSMQPSLVHIDSLSGEIMNRAQLPQELRFNSIRHLTIDSQGNVYISLQSQRSNEKQCLLAIFDSNTKTITPCGIPDNVINKLQHYLGDIALDDSEQYFMTTSPRGDQALVFSREGVFLDSVTISDVCGVAKTPKTGVFRVTSGDGQITELIFNEQTKCLSRRDISGLQININLSWDNHLIFINPA